MYLQAWDESQLQFISQSRKNFPGLLQLVEGHMPVLRNQDLITDRKPIVMKAADDTIIEIFEWRSQDAIQHAHNNAEVLKLWEEFNLVCDYAIPAQVAEFHNMFSEFTPVEFPLN